MTTHKKNRRAQHSSEAICCECGCQVNPSTTLHFHHTKPTDPSEVTDLPGEMMSANPPSIGPEALLDMASRRSKDPTDDVMNPMDSSIQIGDLVKVCVLVRDLRGVWLPREFRHMLAQFESEAMWVQILQREGSGASATYQGVLWSIPIFIDPRKLQIRSSVTLEARNIHSVFTPVYSPGSDEIH